MHSYLLWDPVSSYLKDDVQIVFYGNQKPYQPHHLYECLVGGGGGLSPVLGAVVHKSYVLNHFSAVQCTNEESCSDSSERNPFVTNATFWANINKYYRAVLDLSNSNTNFFVFIKDVLQSYSVFKFMYVFLTVPFSVGDSNEHAELESVEIFEISLTASDI